MTNNYLILMLLSLTIAICCWQTAMMMMIQQEMPKVCGTYVGCMQGKYMPGYQTDKFEAFLGIPYALPPVGELRFSNPKAYPRWDDVLNATEARMDCIQKNYLVPHPQVHGVEDCLYLNVYRPAVRSRQLLPVMAYIHGGGWFSGSANPLIVGPEYFMDTKEVILVTFTYRLGALGFLSTNDSNMSGNFGLKDQNLALRWVQKNIASFGGDPKMVTIFGQSSGAVSAHMHMLSKQSEGLFRNVISLSGTANVPFAIADEPLKQARKTAELCNISNAYELSTAKLTRALRAIDAKSLVQAGDGLKYWHVDTLTNYRPVVENIGAKDAFLTQPPKQLLAKGSYRAVPWMVGIVPQEGAVRVLSILSNETLRTDFNANFNELLEKLMEFPERFNHSQLSEKMKHIIDEYFQGQQELNNVTAQGFLDTVTDRGFLQPLFNVIRTYVLTINTKEHPVYLYKFNYDGPHTHTYANIYTGGQSNRHFGVVHCDDLIYLFRSPILFSDFDKNSTHAQVVKAFTQNLVHFAKYGKPMHSDLLKPCNDITFNSKSETICDYQEYINMPSNSFTIRINNEFSVRRTQMWNNLLEDRHEISTASVV